LINNFKNLKNNKFIKNKNRGIVVSKKIKRNKKRLAKIKINVYQNLMKKRFKNKKKYLGKKN